MEFFNSNKFIVIVVLILISASVFGCAKKQNERFIAPTIYTYPEERNVATSHPVIPVDEKKLKIPTIADTIGNIDRIGKTLGCVFSPGSCN